MDTNITIPTLGAAMNLVYSDKDSGSLRRKTGLSPSLPHEMTVKHTTYVDSKSKISGRRSVLRFDQHIVVDAAGTIAPLTAYVVWAVPQGSVDLTPYLISTNTKLAQCIAVGAIAAGEALNLGDAIARNGEQ